MGRALRHGCAGLYGGSDPHALPGGDYGGDLVLYLNPGSGWWQDASKTIASEASDAVHTWADASVNGYDSIQSSGTSQYIVSATPRFNGYHGVDCDGINDGSTSTISAISQPYTFFIVYERLSNFDNKYVSFTNAAPGVLPQNDGGQHLIRYSFGGSTKQSGDILPSEQGIAVYIADTTGGSEWYNQATDAFVASSAGESDMTNPEVNRAGYNRSNASICAMGIINRALDASEKAALKDFLRSTYLGL